MREAVLNREGLSVRFPNKDQALDALDKIASGLVLLSNRKYIAPHLWMKDQPYEIFVCPETNLLELFREYLSIDKDKATFLLRMTTRCPIDDGVEVTNLEHFLENEIEGLPHCTDLLWCAVSGTKIAISLSPDSYWKQNPLPLRVLRNGTFFRTAKVENVFSVESAQETADRLNALELTKISPNDLWRRSGDLFPRLLFGRDVEKQLQSLGTNLFSSAIVRFVELDKAASEWDAASQASPEYLSKVTGESSATMQKYGNERVYRSSLGSSEVYELHARLQCGGRIHLREIPEHSKVEIGYVGKHLRIVSE